MVTLAILFIVIHNARSASFLYTYSSLKHAHLSILKLRQRLWILSIENRNNFFQIVINDRNLYSYLLYVIQQSWVHIRNCSAIKDKNVNSSNAIP